jgi:hypothetical protein
MKQNEPNYHHLEKPTWPKVFVWKRTQFSLWSHVLDTAASKIGGCLWRGTCISSTLLNRPSWRQQSLCPPWNTYVSERFRFQKLTQFSQETMCYMLLRLKQMVFFQEMHVFLQLTWIALFESKWAFLHLENSDFQEIFLSNTVSILTVKQWAGYCNF